jgi:hypothetical protein
VFVVTLVPFRLAPAKAFDALERSASWQRNIGVASLAGCFALTLIGPGRRRRRLACAVHPDPPERPNAARGDGVPGGPVRTMYVPDLSSRRPSSRTAPWHRLADLARA